MKFGFSPWAHCCMGEKVSSSQVWRRRHFFDAQKSIACSLLSCYNNYVTAFDLGYTPYTGCNIYSERNYFDAGNYKGCVVDDHGVGCFTDSQSVLSWDISNIKTSASSFRPIKNYSYATRDASSAKAWCQKYTGVQSSNIIYAID